MKQNKYMTMASCFSGIGGEMVAASMMGWDVKFFCEINSFGRQVLSYWFPNAKSYEDITRTDFSEWRGKIDVLTGGFPCQPFSYAGKRGGAQDDRYLWPFMFAAIDQIRPTWVVCENVAGITTMVEQGEVSKVAGAATLFDAFDYIINDSNYLVYLYALIANCEESTDSEKIISAVKELAKGHRVSDNLLEKLKVNL